jgi:Flp pilus assembly protein TadG
MRFLFVLLAVFGFYQLQAQEINASVAINTPKIQTADPKIFKNLQTAVKEFLNSRKWTNDNYEVEERIELNVVITITKEISATRFEAELLVQANRPVYNSGYNSLIFQFLDKDFVFDYGEFEVLDFTEGVFTNNLSATLAFYAYMVLGADYDTFSELGGDDYFNKAQMILNSAPQGARGWARDGNQSKARLIENYLNVRVQPLRRAMYQYHLLGLDLLSKDETMNDGIQNIAKALETAQKVNTDFPGSLIIQNFVSMKREEVLGVFSVADIRLKRKVYDLMVKMDGSKANEYRPLLQ